MSWQLSSSFVLAAVGDVLLLHPVSSHMIDAASSRLRELLREADVTFGNCEVNGFDGESSGAIPQAESGGLWLNAGADGIADLEALGFTLMSRANNHSLDFGTAGMDATSRLLARHAIAHAGTGPHLAGARAPVYITTRAGRTALISATDSTPTFARAGRARPDMIGRPGVNAIRASPVKTVDGVTFEALVKALEVARAQQCHLGQVADDGQAIRGLGPLIRKGERLDHDYDLAERDLDENLQQVRLARGRADHVLFALHTHLNGRDVDTPPQAIRAFARRVIEAGADAVIGHGPHMLRGIEIHRGRPIFYGLGNFVCHLLKVGSQPSEWYEKRGLDGARATLAEIFDDHVDEKRNDFDFWTSVIARIVQHGASRRIELHPIELAPHAAGAQMGTPRMADPATATRILERLCRLSRPLGTEITCADGVGIVECPA